jgi:hypothetical protein
MTVHALSGIRFAASLEICSWTDSSGQLTAAGKNGLREAENYEHLLLNAALSSH